ncbi:uncharacterized protein EV420DRAFT_1652372 [Desarmillaria tabescens]|uniref:Uncharacterized protein n=1 Tax=Armillaria tabescens TaxID=1929756 RepID=A0AA39J657_ARMTA|nr:uncharacterized protein EV420DRAFT_1652372 [Desarmillaria tabescens]KAK0436836.1 hypothetical protein EV420DRAFT_1652372 [Desarmillaria tabescens]
MARLEREVYECDIPTQHCGSSAGSNSSGNSRWRSRAPSWTAADPPHEPLTIGIDRQASVYHAPTIAPTAAPAIPRVQYLASFPMNIDDNVMLQDVHVTQGQRNQQVHATQGMEAPYQPQASISVPAAITESSDSQIHNPVPYYHNASSQSFNAVMNQAAAITQYLPSAPVAAPVARCLNPVTTLSTHHWLDGDTYNRNNGWGEPSTMYASSSSFVEVGSSNHGAGSNSHGREPNHDGEPSTCYEFPPENIWDGLYGQH